MRYVRYLVRNFPKTKILVLTMISNPMIISKLYAVGVWGVLLKHEKITEITAAINSIRRNNKYYPKSYSMKKLESTQKATVEKKLAHFHPENLKS